MYLNIVEKTKEKYLEYEQRHKNILDVAIRIFNDRGYKAATTAAIAKEAGISEHTMYQHFKNKKLLFLACFRSIVDELMTGYRQVYKENKDNEIGCLKGFEKVYRDFVLNNPHKSMFFFHLYSYKSDPEIGGSVNEFNEYVKRSIEVAEQMVSAGKRKGLIKSKMNDKVLASIFISGYFTTVFVKDHVGANGLADAMSDWTNALLGIKG